MDADEEQTKERTEERTDVSLQHVGDLHGESRRQLLIQFLRQEMVQEEMMRDIMDVVHREMKKLYREIPYHTSILTGQGWLGELLRGHPERMRSELGVHRHVFLRLITSLMSSGIEDSHHVGIGEQLAIFLFTCVTGNSIRHVGERFQHSNETILKYFTRILVALSSAPFYATHVCLPRVTDAVPARIWDDPKLCPWFLNALGALDRTHVHCAPSAAERHTTRDYKGPFTHNCLAVCSFDMKFLYMYSGLDGAAAADPTMFDEARITELCVPEGKYYLADADFPACATLLVPYRGLHNNLQGWGQAQAHPANPEELFNVRHTSAWNVVERTIEVLKRRFHILVHAPELDMRMQARIPCALAAVHNFIRKEDPLDIEDFCVEPPLVLQGTETGQLDAGRAQLAAERREGLELRDRIAQAMWQNYQQAQLQQGQAASI